MAADKDAEIHVLIVVAAVRFDGSTLTPMNSVMEADPRLTEMWRRLNELDRVTGRPAYGLPVEELGSFAEEVDLLVLGSASEGPRGHLVASGISKYLARTAQCPLLVFPLEPTFTHDGSALSGTAPESFDRGEMT